MGQDDKGKKKARRKAQNKNYQARRTLFKRKLVDDSGGKCKVCGYNRCLRALEFHHIDPKKKNFPITDFINSRTSLDNYEEALKETKLCALVCRNCHAEIHAGLVEINGKKLKRKKGKRLS